MALPRPSCVACVAALALAGAFAPLHRPQPQQLKRPAVSRRRAPTLLRASDDNLPRSDNGTRDDEFEVEPRAVSVEERKLREALAAEDAPTAALAKSDDETNPYYKLVAELSPGEIIGRFAATAPPRVQDAVKQTIMGLLGNAGSFALETATVTTSEKLANLMFQLQMTGYMFKNAEYRLSLSSSLQDVPLLEGADDGSLPPVEGQVKVNVMGEEVSIDADAYMAELREDVETLRKELDLVEEARREATQADLLAYVRALPEQQMAALTSEITDDVLDGMKKLVYSIMKGMGTSSVEANTQLQQSGSAMAQLCMWQLAIGYNLRELEVKDLLSKQLEAGSSEADAVDA